MNITTTNNPSISAIRKEFTVYAKKPMPDSALWHQATNWRHAKTLYNDYPSIWNKLKKQNAIPLDILKKYEND